MFLSVQLGRDIEISMVYITETDDEVFKMKCLLCSDKRDTYKIDPTMWKVISLVNLGSDECLLLYLLGFLFLIKGNI